MQLTAVGLPGSPGPSADWADARLARLTDLAAPVAPAFRVAVLGGALALVVVPTLLLLGPAFH